MRQLAILAVAILVILAAPSAARCDDLDDLKAAHAAFVETWDANDAKALLDHIHDEAIRLT